jgi:hypothetical protein
LEIYSGWRDLRFIRGLVVDRLTSRKRSSKKSSLVYYHNQLSMLGKRFMMTL